jgi:hypothetical protein
VRGEDERTTHTHHAVLQSLRFSTILVIKKSLQANEMKSFTLCCFLSFSPAIVHSLAASNTNAGGGGFGSAKEITVHSPDTSGSTQNLLQFLNAQNAIGLQNVEIGYHDETGVRGLFALKKFKKGQLMCQIPSNCALALTDPSKNGDDTPTLSHGGANFLSMYWNNEQARKMWSPYLDMLPQKDTPLHDKTPDFFGDEALELLEFPRLIRQARDRKKEISKIAEEKGLDYDELQFATWLTASRAFRISMQVEPDEAGTLLTDERGNIMTKAGKDKAILVMVPLIDMVNHHSDQPNAKLTLIDPEKDDAWFALEATRPIAAGKEIVISYGSGVESSSELLMNYGFVPHTNKIDEYMLKKGGAECIEKLEGWTTTLEEDRSMLPMAEEDLILKTILSFRIKLKEAYK